MIKNAITYHVEMPSAVDMLEFTHEYMAEKPDLGQVKTVGFSAHPLMNEVVTEFPGGYCLSVLMWEKKIPAAAVNNELKEQIEQCEAHYGRPLKKAEKDELKSEIILSLLPTILPSPKYVFAYCHQSTNTLIIDSTSSKDADSATALLRKAIGSLKATTLYIDSRIGLTSSLKNHLNDPSVEFINHEITLGQSLELEGQEGKVKYTDVDLYDKSTSAEICDQIETGGMHIKSVELIGRNGDLTLTSEFKLQKICMGIETDPDMSKQESWLSDSFSCCEFVSSVTDQLVERFKVVE